MKKGNNVKKAKNTKSVKKAALKKKVAKAAVAKYNTDFSTELQLSNHPAE